MKPAELKELQLMLQHWCQTEYPPEPSSWVSAYNYDVTHPSQPILILIHVLYTAFAKIGRNMAKPLLLLSSWFANEGFDSLLPSGITLFWSGSWVQPFLLFSGLTTLAQSFTAAHGCQQGQAVAIRHWTSVPAVRRNSQGLRAVTHRFSMPAGGHSKDRFLTTPLPGMFILFQTKI